MNRVASAASVELYWQGMELPMVNRNEITDAKEQTQRSSRNKLARQDLGW